MITADNRPYQKTEKNAHKTRHYSIWRAMHDRCYNPNNNDYHNYGGRGIRVCEEWNRDNVNGLQNFIKWSLQNGYADNLTIDRINVNGNYEPSNCRWADDKTQANNRRNNRSVTYNGKTYHSLAECCEALGRYEDYKIIHLRITRYGYTLQQAFDEPIGEQGQTSAKPITVNGQTFPSIFEACRELNREEDYGTIHARINHYGWTADRAFNTPIGERQKHITDIPVTVNGQTFPNAKECCRALNLNYSTVSGHKRNHSTTWEEAIKHYTA